MTWNGPVAFVVCLCSPADTKAHPPATPGETAAQPNTPPTPHLVAKIKKLHEFLLFFSLPKWPGDSLQRSYVGQGADANVGQEEPLLSIKTG